MTAEITIVTDEGAQVLSTAEQQQAALEVLLATPAGTQYTADLIAYTLTVAADSVEALSQQDNALHKGTARMLAAGLRIRAASAQQTGDKLAERE